MKHFLLASLLTAGLSLPVWADTILPGTEIRVRTDNPVEVGRIDRGRIYPARVAQDVYSSDGNLAIPRGSYVELIVRQVTPERLALDLESITANGRRYVMDATGPNFHMQDQDFQNGNGIVGSIIGAIANATGNQAETQGDRVFVPADSVLTFQLQEPLHTVDWNDPGYSDHGSHYHHNGDWYR